MEIVDLHQTYKVDVLEDHHYRHIYDYFHNFFGNDKNTNLCFIRSFEYPSYQNQNNQFIRVHCQFENNLFTVDLWLSRIIYPWVTEISSDLVGLKGVLRGSQMTVVKCVPCNATIRWWYKEVQVSFVVNFAEDGKMADNNVIQRLYHYIYRNKRLNRIFMSFSNRIHDTEVIVYRKYGRLKPCKRKYRRNGELLTVSISLMQVYLVDHKSHHCP